MNNTIISGGAGFLLSQVVKKFENDYTSYNYYKSRLLDLFRELI